MIDEVKAPASLVISKLKIAILEHAGKIESEDAGTIRFYTVFTEQMWDVLSLISYGIISVEEKNGISVISYKFSLFRLRCLAGIFLLIASFLFSILNNSSNHFPLLMIFMLSMFLYIGNYIAVYIKVTDLFKSALRD